MFCKNCGKKIQENVEFCSNCGIKINEVKIISKNKDTRIKDDKKIDEKKPLHKNLENLDGWLILVIIGLFVTIFWQLSGIYESIVMFNDGTVEILSNPMSDFYIPGYAGLLKFEFIATILFLVLAAYLIFLFFKKSTKFPKYYILLWISSIIFVVIDYIILSSLIIPIEMKQIIKESLAEAEIEMGRTIIVSIIWSLYIIKSKKVKAIFIRN